MKLLTSLSAWRQWVKDEEGAFADKTHLAPTQFPCYAYLVLESWVEETQKAMYLYQHDLENMSLGLLSAEGSEPNQAE